MVSWWWLIVALMAGGFLGCLLITIFAVKTVIDLEKQLSDLMWERGSR